MWAEFSVVRYDNVAASSELVVAHWITAGLNKNPLHHLPVVMLMGEGIPWTSRWPLIGWPYCSPVTLRKTSVPTCLIRTASSRSQYVSPHCTAHTSKSSPSPFSPNALTSCKHKTNQRDNVIQIQPVTVTWTCRLERRVLCGSTWWLDSGELKWCECRLRPVFMCVIRMASPHRMGSPRWQTLPGFPRIRQ